MSQGFRKKLKKTSFNPLDTGCANWEGRGLGGALHKKHWGRGGGREPMRIVSGLDFGRYLMEHWGFSLESGTGGKFSGGLAGRLSKSLYP